MLEKMKLNFIKRRCWLNNKTKLFVSAQFLYEKFKSEKNILKVSDAWIHKSMEMKFNFFISIPIPEFKWKMYGIIFI